EGSGALQAPRARARGQGQRHTRRLSLPAHPRGARRNRRTICPVSVEQSQTGRPAMEVQQLLSELIRFNTVNPPGEELPLQEHLAQAGFDCELLGAQPKRPNLVARLRSGREGPTLCYLGHVDTVLADPSEWSHDPWSGDLADGFVWGRGALDMKSQVAAEVAAA